MKNALVSLLLVLVASSGFILAGALVVSARSTPIESIVCQSTYKCKLPHRLATVDLVK